MPPFFLSKGGKNAFLFLKTKNGKNSLGMIVIL